MIFFLIEREPYVIDRGQLRPSFETLDCVHLPSVGIHALPKLKVQWVIDDVGPLLELTPAKILFFVQLHQFSIVLIGLLVYT